MKIFKYNPFIHSLPDAISFFQLRMRIIVDSAIVRYRYYTIASSDLASSCNRITVIALSRYQFIAIAASLHRHRITASSHYGRKYRWCDDAIVNH